MTLKTLLAASVLVLVPMIAQAQCESSRLNVSCAEGTTYDTETMTCVAAPTS
ncbi:hypothetical protein HKCCE4037_00135 [Rhodobacterales bacterium HKCCE4037]|nr:hypothetical protein [Rhodobacterales bacterium HKCCE4037]